MLDSAVLIPLYPAREEPIKGITSDTIFTQMKLKDKYLVSKEETLEILRIRENDIVLTMGAGDIDRMVTDIVDILKSRN